MAPLCAEPCEPAFCRRPDTAGWRPRSGNAGSPVEEYQVRTPFPRRSVRSVPPDSARRAGSSLARHPLFAVVGEVAPLVLHVDLLPHHGREDLVVVGGDLERGEDVHRRGGETRTPALWSPRPAR